MPCCVRNSTHLPVVAREGPVNEPVAAMAFCRWVARNAAAEMMVRYLPMSPYISLYTRYLPVSPYISIYLPVAPYSSL